MILVKSVKFGHVFIFRQIKQKNEFNIILEQKMLSRLEKREAKKIEDRKSKIETTPF